MLANTARFEKLLDERPRQVASVNGLKRNLRVKEQNLQGNYFAAILHFSSFSEEIIVSIRAERISANENITETVNSKEGVKLPNIEKNASNSGA